MISCILFDLDGVLADSEPGWNHIDAAFLKVYDVDYRGEHKDQVMGKSYRLAVEFYRERFGLKSEVEQLMLEREAIAHSFYKTEAPIFETVPAVLKALKEMNLKIGLVTGSVGEIVRPFLSRHKVEHFFDAVTTGEEVVHGKPHPDIYLRAAAKFGATANECLVIEDALAGIAAGKAAKMRVVAIPDARFMDLSLYPGEADYQLTSLEEVPSLVKQLNS